MRMLIAEDDRMTADTLGKRLKAEHYAVDICYDGESALDYLLNTDYDMPITVKVIAQEEEKILTLEPLEMKTLDL